MAFLHFLPLFLSGMFWSMPKARRNFEKSSNLAKIWQKMKKTDCSFFVTHFSLKNEKWKICEKQKISFFVGNHTHDSFRSQLMKYICNIPLAIFKYYYITFKRPSTVFLPRYCRWTLIWCILPVLGLQSTTEVLPLKLSLWKSVWQSLPLLETLHTPIL